MGSRAIIFIFSFFCCVFFSLGQEVSVKEILREVTSKHQVTFSYLDKNINQAYVKEPADSLSLEAVMELVSQQTNLVFKKIDLHNYAVLPGTAQEKWVCGYLSDERTGEPIADALVYGSFFTVSNEKGFFQMKARPNEYISVQHIAYENKIISVSDSSDAKCYTLIMRSRVTSLPQVTIYNYISRGIHKAKDGSLLFLVDPMRMLPGLIESDILHSLQVLPGVTSINETVADINIRGGTNDQNLVLYEGVRVYQPGHFFGLISVFNPQTIDKARLFKQGTPAQFGDAVSGTVILQTEDQLPEKTKLTTGLNMLYTDIAAEFPIGKKSGAYVSARRSVGDWLQTPTYKSYFTRAFRDTEVINSSANAAALANSDQQFYFYDLHGKFLHEPSEKDRLSLDVLGIANQVSFSENAVVNNIVKTRKSTLQQKSYLAGLRYEKQWSQNFRSGLMASASAYQLEAINARIVENQSLFQLNEVLDLQLKSVSSLLIGSSSFTFGYQGNNIGVTNGTRLTTPSIDEEIKKVITTHAVFLEGNRELVNTDMTLGLRSSYIPDLRQVIWEPRLAIRQKLSGQLTAEVTGEVKSQTLFQKIDFQTDFLGIEKRKWILDESPSFEYIRSRQASAGLEYTNNSILISAEGYIKSVNNIAASSQGFLNQLQTFTGHGSYLVSGVDGLVNASLERYNVWVSYSFAKNRYRFDEWIPQVFPSNFDIPHSLSLGTNYETAALDMAMGVNWRTGSPYTGLNVSDSLNKELSFASPNGQRISNYFRVDTSAKYRFDLWKQKLVLGISIWNVLNRKNTIQAYYSKNSIGETVFIERYALPFTLNGSLRIFF